ncbi:MAG: hypothetical protein H0X37_20305 [Herpetosiphonaceae bacterium]|nr:hypothetical protein [Herpetosiphonaceae bacterium]
MALSVYTRRLRSWAYTHVPGLRQLWARTTREVVEQQEIPWADLRTPLRACRVAAITTGGVHLLDQVPFNMRDPQGDPSSRIIPAGTPHSGLTITHNYYDHRDAERDLDILFPIALLASLAERGVIGSVADCYSFMGHIAGAHVMTLAQRSAPEVARLLKQQQVDAVLLTPA